MTKLEASKNDIGKYKIQIISDNVVYAKNLKSGYYLLRLNYLVFWKKYITTKIFRNLY